MLKKLCIALIICLCVSLLGGCGEGNGTNKTAENSSSRAQENTSDLPADINGTALSIKYEKPYSAGRLKNSHSTVGSRVSGNISLSFEGYMPRFTSEISLAGADSIERYYENMIGYTEFLRTRFLMQPPLPSDTPCTYYDYSDYRVDFVGEAYMSVTRYNETYMGGEYVSHTFGADNFNLKTGRILSLGDLFGGDIESYTQKLNALIYGELKKHPSFPALFSEVKKDNLHEYIDNNTFVLTPNGLGFIFNECEIAPHSSGTVNITVPYEALDGILKINVFEKI